MTYSRDSPGPFTTSDGAAAGDAHEDQLDFPVIYTNGKLGIAKRNLEDQSADLRPLFELILEHIPPPVGDPAEILQMLVANLARAALPTRTILR